MNTVTDKSSLFFVVLECVIIVLLLININMLVHRNHALKEYHGKAEMMQEICFASKEGLI